MNVQVIMHGFGLKELARTAGISPHYRTLIERGQRPPDGAIRRALAKSLDVTAWEDHF